MIYSPYVVLNLRRVLAQSVIKAAIVAAFDFIAQDGKDWAYYPGVALGNMAAATGIEGAAATLYVVGDSVDALIFKSEDGSLVRVFLDGVLYAEIDSWTDEPLWETIAVTGLTSGVLHRIDFVNANNTNPEKSSAINWLAIGQIQVNGEGAYAQEKTEVTDTVVFRIQDAEADSPLASYPVRIPSGESVADITTWAQAVAGELDAATDGQVVEINVTLNIALPGGLKASPNAGSLNERGLLMAFTTEGPRPDSLRIPAVGLTLMPGNSVNTGLSPWSDLITRLTTATTAANIRPVSANDYNLSAIKAAKKSFRKR